MISIIRGNGYEADRYTIRNRILLGFKKYPFELLSRKRYLCAHEKVSEHKQESTCRAGCSCWNNRPVSDFSSEAPDE